MAGAAVAGTVAGGVYSLSELAKLAGFELSTQSGTSSTLSTEEQTAGKIKRFKKAVDLTKEQLELEKQLTEAKVLSNKKSTPKE